MNIDRFKRKNSDWQTLVGDIAELEELIAEVHGSHDGDAHSSLHQLRSTLKDKRQQLKALDVGLMFQADRQSGVTLSS